MVAAVKVAAVVVTGQRWWQGWWWAHGGGVGSLMVSGVGAGEPQVSYGLSEVCVDEPGPEASRAHQGQRIGDGVHGLTAEPEPEPKRSMAQWQRCYVQSDGGLWLQGSCGCRAVADAGK